MLFNWCVKNLKELVSIIGGRELIVELVASIIKKETLKLVDLDAVDRNQYLIIEYQKDSSSNSFIL